MIFIKANKTIFLEGKGPTLIVFNTLRMIEYCLFAVTHEQSSNNNQFHRVTVCH